MIIIYSVLASIFAITLLLLACLIPAMGLETFLTCAILVSIIATAVFAALIAYTVIRIYYLKRDE